MGRLLLADGGHDAVVVATASLVAMAVSKSSVAAAAVRRVEGAMSGGHQMLKWRAYICYAPCRSSYYRPSSAHACGREHHGSAGSRPAARAECRRRRAPSSTAAPAC